MQAEIIGIGSELTSGATINTNAPYISRKLADIGITVTQHLAIADKNNTIISALRQALEQFPLVITTGGLGPTVDDITRNAAAEVMQSSIGFNEEVAAHLQKQFGQFDTLQDQATIPTKARPIHNRVGSAPGLIFEEGNKTLVLLPGVPVEMIAMLDELLPYLQKRYPASQRPFSFSLHFHTLREADVDPLLRKLQPNYPDIEFGIYPHLWTVTIRLTVQAANQEEAKRLVEKPFNELRDTFGDHYFEGSSIEEAVQRQFIEKNLTLSTAESCTGGSIAASLTKIPGASAYFLGSVVAYSNELKKSLLDVPVELIDKHGAVSGEVAAAMLEGLFKKTNSDWGLSVTGIAGPSGGTAEKPVGTVWFAIGAKGQKPLVKNLQVKGNREAIIVKSVHLILGNLLRSL